MNNGSVTAKGGHLSCLGLPWNNSRGQSQDMMHIKQWNRWKQNSSFFSQEWKEISNTIKPDAKPKYRKYDVKKQSLDIVKHSNVTMCLKWHVYILYTDCNGIYCSPHTIWHMWGLSFGALHNPGTICHVETILRITFNSFMFVFS